MSTMAILPVLLRLRLDQIIHSEVLHVFLLFVCRPVCLSLYAYIFSAEVFGLNYLVLSYCFFLACFFLSLHFHLMMPIAL